jgi:hypothetical protein
VKAYAIRFCGAFYLVNAENGRKARGRLLISAFNADPQYRRHLKGLQCRRWPEFDGGGPRVDYWGYPGERVDGARVEIPAPFLEALRDPR